MSGEDGNEIDLDKMKWEFGSGNMSLINVMNSNQSENEVFIFDKRNEDLTASYFARPGNLAGKHKFKFINYYL